MEERTVFIISGGMLEEQFTYSYIASEHKAGDVIIAAEGGVEFCLRHGLVPTKAVGDFDSAGEAVLAKVRQEGIPVDLYPSEKDETDTGIAVAAAFSYHPDRILLFGATGTRLDHVHANLAILARLAEDPETSNADVRIVDPHNEIMIRTQPFVISRKEGAKKQYVSLFAWSEEVQGLTLAGMKYPLTDYILRKGDSIGTSNEMTGETAEVSFSKGTLLVIRSHD